MNRLLPSMAVILGFLTFCGQVFAETTPSSVRDLILIGLQQNSSLQVEQLNIPLASEAVTINESVFDPELYAATGYLETSTPIASSLSLVEQSDYDELTGELGVRKKYRSGLLASLSIDSVWAEENSLTNDLNPEYRTSLNLNLSQPLLRDFGTDTNTAELRASRNRFDQSTLSHLLEAQSLALEIETLTSQLAAGDQIVSLRMEAFRLAQELYTANKRRFDAGVIPISEVQEAETSVANRELELSLAEQARDLYFEDLNRKLNYALTLDFEPISFFDFTADIDRPDLPAFQQLLSAARNKNIYLQLNRIDIKNAAIQQDFYENQLKPQLDLNLLLGLNGLSGDQRAGVNSRYAGDWNDSLASAAESDGYQWGVGLEFSIPLGNRSAKSRLRQSQLQLKQNNYQRRDLEEELRTSLQRQLITLQRAHEQVGIAQRFEQLSVKTLTQEQRRLEEGLSDTFRMIVIQTNLVNSKIDRIDALTQYYVALARMNFVRGINLEVHDIYLDQSLKEKSVENI